jgi:tetrahydromethanopterin:alpha-L-glutamate ligase
VDGVFYLQQKITATHDFRVLIVNHQPVAAMRRTGQNWLHNVAQGASCEKSTEADVQEIAVQAAKMLGIDYCGVDVIRDQDGKLWVLEVNSIPAWRGLQSVMDFNIAEVLANDFLQKLAFENC